MGCGPSRVRGARYESFVKDTNKSIEEASRAITNKTEEKATAEADKTAAEEDKNSAMNEQQQNQNENADLHKACDFTLENFEVPEEHRASRARAERQHSFVRTDSECRRTFAPVH